MWCTLESYNNTFECASNATQGPSLTTDENALAEVQNASDVSASEMRNVVNLQQTSHPDLETVFEESCVLNNRNQYPPNMVFDPQYPEWYYDMVTQSWYTLESYNHALHDASNVTQGQFAANVNALDKVQNAFEGPVQEILDAVNLQQTSQPVLEAISEKTSVFNSNNHGPQDSICYTPSMLFDPQYPGWYYDTISQMWHTLESNNHALHDASNATQGLLTNNANVLAGLSIDEHPHLYGNHAQSGQSAMLEKSQQKSDWNAFASGFNKQSRWEEKTGHKGHWNTSGGGYGPPSMWQEQTSKGSHPDKQLDSINLEPIVKLNYGRSNLTSASSYVSSESINHVNHPNVKLCANSIYSKFSCTPNEVRSTAGRPPHALVTFGFGGKIIVMKDDSFSNSSSVSGSQESAGGVVLIHTLVDVVMTKADFSNTSVGYFHALCHDSFPGPLVGGSAASKDVNKWINDRITRSESSGMDVQNGLLLKLLLSLLKILCQHNGRLRSPYGINPSHEGSDGPESAVSMLFASAKRSNAPVGGGSSRHCMTNPPPEANIRATVTEVQNLLVSGRRKEALHCAQEGELWGTAVVLAAQLDVFSADSSTSGSSGAVNRSYQCSEVQPNGLLDDWQVNLAIIASNRTKDDELVIIHLGDSLWKERGEVTAAHACYLLAEVNFEPYSDSARLCLIGADHWKNTRTYACPDSIQRTEIYEYSKVLGNSQFVLLPFQPYKLVYAYMLAEVGKVYDSLRYCQASMKMLKYSGRSAEVELWRTLFSSLEERLRNHQQSGYSTNLAPTKLVGKLFNSIDRSIHRMIGVPPLPPMLQKSGEDRDNNSLGQKVSSSQSATAITSLMSSPSIEAISEWTGDGGGKVVHNRSISEPDFRSTKNNLSKSSGSYGQSNASISGGPSRFGRIGFQILQKTIGWVSRTRPDRQAKLGESNKFYYDEKLKRWVEEGAELPASEAFLPPPPMAASFQNGKSDYDVKNVLKSNGLIMDAKQETQLDTPSEQVFGLPPVPPSQNQFSARSRGGVRSRYVDTFNKRDGSVTSTFHSPSAPSVKPLSGANFFIPSAPANHEDQTSDASIRSSIHETAITEEPSTSVVQDSIFSPPSN
ncbi:protein transport protein SEC16A homolog isoform X2 [Phalaenopsis equestris]|uniref:protein transport protein SEC16A homolog isoform X2 n=1 Tax=Phalaenopsis equestris TaxID=78828 RepID=UPI0009E2603F|nr:protein transport protein SEC16A homolog isoform X2 [Phalaenopsis equestris]